LLKPSRFFLLKAGAGFFCGKPFTAFKLAEGPLDLLMDDVAVIGQERFFFVKHLNGSLHEVINGLIRAALHILLDQSLQFGLEVNGHKGKISPAPYWRAAIRRAQRQLFLRLPLFDQLPQHFDHGRMRARSPGTNEVEA
jgi:hypothetical protein